MPRKKPFIPMFEKPVYADACKCPKTAGGVLWHRLGKCMDCGGMIGGSMNVREESHFDKQEGGDHYKKLAIQPAVYVHRNNIPYLEGSVIYYVTRWRDKNGVADLDKAIHTLQLLKELELKKENEDA